MSVPEFNQRNTAAEQTVDDTNAWVAQFAPLIISSGDVGVPEIKERLALIQQLGSDSAALRARLTLHNLDAPPALVETFESAVSQLDSLETDYRKRLAKLAPGDPGGIADLKAVQEKLEQRAARQELGVATEEEIPAVLEIKTSPGNLPAALAMGVFGLGWTAFTTLHAVLMIGGMMQAIGWAALFLLAFYSIFFLVGFGLLAGAFGQGATENIKLEGRQLTVVKKLGVVTRSKTYTLSPGIQAKIEVPVTASSSKNSTTPSIVLTDSEGRPVSIASSATEASREQVCARINAYLAAQD